MDLNRLYAEHQVVAFRANRSPQSGRCQLLFEASRLAAQIAEFQRSLGAKAAGGWEYLTTSIEGHAPRSAACTSPAAAPLLGGSIKP
jgi:hypothetical protein